MKSFIKNWLKLFLCLFLALESGETANAITAGNKNSDEIADIDNYFASRTKLVGASKVNKNNIVIPSWITNQKAYGYLVIPGYYAAIINPVTDYYSDGYHQSVIDCDETGLWDWYKGAEYFEEKGVNLFMDHNFSNYESNYNDPSFPAEADDLYWTKFLPIGSECYVIDRRNINVMIFQLVDRYEEYKYANFAFHENNDFNEEIKNRYKNVDSGDLLMVTCDADCTDEDQHVWVTHWKVTSVYQHS